MLLARCIAELSSHSCTPQTCSVLSTDELLHLIAARQEHSSEALHTCRPAVSAKRPSSSKDSASVYESDVFSPCLQHTQPQLLCQVRNWLLLAASRCCSPLEVDADQEYALRVALHHVQLSLPAQLLIALLLQAKSLSGLRLCIC